MIPSSKIKNKKHGNSAFVVSSIAIFFFFLLSLPLNTLAQDESLLVEFKQKIAKTSQEIKTISCNFVQTKKIPAIKNIVNSVGDFYFDQSGKIALIYTQPQGDKVIMNNEDFVIVTDGKVMKSSAKSNPMLGQISAMLQACMSGDISKLGSGWDFKVLKNENEYQISLLPTDKRIKKYIKMIALDFCEETLTLNRMRMDENSGAYTEYLFQDKQLNKNISATIFTH